MAGAVRDRLVEQRERIAHGSLGRPRNRLQRLGISLDVLQPAELRQMLDQLVGGDELEIEALEAEIDAQSITTMRE
jgi:hypothetical protein